MNERDKKIAKQIGISDYEIEEDDLLTMFVRLIREDEREACAKLADEIDPVWESLSVAIRNRGNK